MIRSGGSFDGIVGHSEHHIQAATFYAVKMDDICSRFFIFLIFIDRAKIQ